VQARMAQMARNQERELRRQRRRERRHILEAMRLVAENLQVNPVYPSDTDDLGVREPTPDSDRTP
jgi:hypothetical protein